MKSDVAHDGVRGAAHVSLPEHVFVCGHPALDLAATLRARRTRRRETLPTPDRLDTWFLGCGLLDLVTPSRQSDLVRARALREAVHLLVDARRRGGPYDTGALAVLNTAARRTPATPQLTPDGRHTTGSPAQALSLLARQAVELLGGPDAALLKECGNPECTRVYLDRSRGARRQWCGMEPCGNRAKAAVHRARRRRLPVPVPVLVPVSVPVPVPAPR